MSKVNADRSDYVEMCARVGDVVLALAVEGLETYRSSVAEILKRDLELNQSADGKTKNLVQHAINVLELDTLKSGAEM